MKKNLFVFIIIVFITLLSNDLFARYYIPNKGLAYNFSRKVLLVELMEENKVTLMKMGDDEELIANYKAYVQYFNNTLKKIFPKYWNINDSIRFVTYSEKSELMKGDVNKYAVFTSFWNKVYWQPKSQTTKQQDGGTVKYDVFTFSAKSGNKSVLSISLPSDELSEGDFVLVCKIFNAYFRYAKNGLKQQDVCDQNKNIETLENKTLLITRQGFDGDKEKLEKKYGTKFDLTDAFLADETIKEEKPGYAVVTLLWSDLAKEWYYTAIDLSNGDILAVDEVDGPQFEILKGYENKEAVEGASSSLSYRNKLNIEVYQIANFKNKIVQRKCSKAGDNQEMY